MAPLLVTVLALVAVVLSGGSLVRKGRLDRRSYHAIVAIMTAVVIASAALPYLTGGRS